MLRKRWMRAMRDAVALEGDGRRTKALGAASTAVDRLSFVLRRALPPGRRERCACLSANGAEEYHAMAGAWVAPVR